MEDRNKEMRGVKFSHVGRVGALMGDDDALGFVVV